MSAVRFDRLDAIYEIYGVANKSRINPLDAVIGFSRFEVDLYGMRWEFATERRETNSWRDGGEGEEVVEGRKKKGNSVDGRSVVRGRSKDVFLRRSLDGRSERA